MTTNFLTLTEQSVLTAEPRPSTQIKDTSKILNVTTGAKFKIAPGVEPKNGKVPVLLWVYEGHSRPSDADVTYIGESHTFSRIGVDLIKHFEGLRLTAYRDAVGVLTIGYGHTGDVSEGQVIDESKAVTLLAADIQSFERHVHRVVTASMTQAEFDAFVAFSYNVGYTAFEDSTMLSMFNAGQKVSAAKQFDRWVHGNGVVLPGLVRRRAAERALFEGKEDRALELMAA